MLTIKFHYRGSCRGEEHEGRLFVRLIHERDIAVITTPMRIYKKEWDPALQLPRWQEASDPARRSYLQGLIPRIEKERESLRSLAGKLEEEGRLCVNLLSSLYRQSGSEPTWLLLEKELCRELVELGRFRTAEAYRSSVRRLLLFAGKKDLALRSVDSLLIKRFERQLIDEGKSMNTISFYMRNLRAMLFKAVKRDWLVAPKGNLFAEVFTGVEATRKRAIPKEELARLSHLFEDSSSCLNPKERDALGLFLFSFHARGMSFVDLAHLKKENIREGRICYVRRKTGRRVEVELNSELRKLLRYFGKERKESLYLLPVISDPYSDSRRQYLQRLRDQNRRLKQLGRFQHKALSLSTHMARHSWATIAKGEHISTRVISECLGHSSEKTTRIYLDSFDRSVLDAAGRKVVRSLQKVVV